MTEARTRVHQSEQRDRETGPAGHARANLADSATTHAHDAPGRVSPRTGRPEWPVQAWKVTRHGGLIRLRGEFDDHDLEQVRAVVPARQVTRHERHILIWPPGTGSVQLHANGMVLLTGHFDIWEVTAIRAVHPGQAVTHDGDRVTIWPTTVAPTDLSQGETS
ncbi:hypothetical protein P8605_14215 [Streptomyces sp. T-3]|nr:hypothetical protein [Streptomyces sp. T-3]